MPSLEFFVVAESVAVDQNTNRLSVFNIVEEISAPRFPAVHPSLVAVTCLLLDQESEVGLDFQLNLKLSLASVGGKIEDLGSFASNFTAQSVRHRILQEFRGLKLPTAGMLRVEQTLNGGHVASHMITVAQAVAGEQSPAALPA